MVEFVIVEAVRDDGGPLTCRICGQPIDRSLGEHHFVESPYADCGPCYRAEMAEQEANRDGEAW